LHPWPKSGQLCEITGFSDPADVKFVKRKQIVASQLIDVFPSVLERNQYFGALILLTILAIDSGTVVHQMYLLNFSRIEWSRIIRTPRSHVHQFHAQFTSRLARLRNPLKWSLLKTQATAHCGQWLTLDHTNDILGSKFAHLLCPFAHCPLSRTLYRVTWYNQQIDGDAEFTVLLLVNSHSGKGDRFDTVKKA
jgi:hypothetical protein